MMRRIFRNEGALICMSLLFENLKLGLEEAIDYEKGRGRLALKRL